MKANAYKGLMPKWPVIFVTFFLSLWLSPDLRARDDGNGQALFQYYCAQCHGEKGDGKGVNATEDLPAQPKDFTSPKTLPVFSDEQIINTITQGGPREQLSFIMPPWGNILTAEEIERLRDHLRVFCQCRFSPGAAAGAKAGKNRQKQ